MNGHTNEHTNQPTDQQTRRIVIPHVDVIIVNNMSELYHCRKMQGKQESLDFPEQIRLVNLHRLLHGLRTVKLSASISLTDEQVRAFVVWH